MIVLISNILFSIPVYAQEQAEPGIQNEVPVVNKFSYNVQKYSGFNFLIDSLVEGIIKLVFKIKTHADDIDIRLDIYSGWDLIRKKAKYFKLSAYKLSVKNIPIEEILLETSEPIYFKKYEDKKNHAVIPLDLNLKMKINLADITEVLNNLPKWRKVLGELDLPIPPFGTTRVELKDIVISVQENGLVNFSCLLKSLVKADSEPINLKFTGKLAIKENKLIIDELESEAEDIFTKDSEMSKSFSQFLEDLINPVFNFHKYEKNGLRIDSVNLFYFPDSLLFDVKFKLLPP
ncbi:MAG: hypothetical protein A3B68_06880 [Candidatus Melainabacteria bacterium RIFCSPHIGHO2_02_FULL_34_12]|nr:MAG: hypothetical protein A3B68_06880 [Candidatus Melainabacteria bacterium RIFCSPHIGHO2_02_FULL_34_12]